MKPPAEQRWHRPHCIPVAQLQAGRGLSCNHTHRQPLRFHRNMQPGRSSPICSGRRFWFPGGTEDAVTRLTWENNVKPTAIHAWKMPDHGEDWSSRRTCGWRGEGSLYLSVGLIHILENGIQQKGKPAEHVKGYVLFSETFV